MVYRIILRSEWGARYDNGADTAPLPAREVWLHHSAGVAPDLVPPYADDYAAIRTLERIGQGRFGAGISYTWLITPVGLIFEGHSPNRQGTHTGGRNDIARAVCFVGNYETTAPTNAQLAATAWLLQHAKRQGWITQTRLNGGHRDLKQTACPGQHAYVRIGDINRLASGPPITEDDMFSDTDRNMLTSLWVAMFGDQPGERQTAEGLSREQSVLGRLQALENPVLSTHRQMFWPTDVPADEAPPATYGPAVTTQLADIRAQLDRIEGAQP